MIEGYLGVFVLGIIVGVVLTLYAKGITLRRAPSKKLKHIRVKPKRFHIGWK